MDREIYQLKYARFLQRLRNAREESGLTQAQVARAVGKAQGFISKVESGERRLDVVELQELCRVYEKPLSYFEEALEGGD